MLASSISGARAVSVGTSASHLEERGGWLFRYIRV